MGGIAGYVKVDVVGLDKRAIEGRTTGKESSADGIGTYEHYHLWVGRCIEAHLKGLGHIRRNRTSNYHPIGMARRGYELDTEAPHVEVDVSGSLSLHLARVFARRRHVP